MSINEEKTLKMGEKNFGSIAVFFFGPRFVNGVDSGESGNGGKGSDSGIYG